MTAPKSLRKIQMGLESAAGSEANASVIWRGTGTIEDTQEVVFVEEDVGILGGTLRNYIPQVGAKINFDATPATFEQLPYLLTAGIAPLTTGVTDVGGSGKIYTYTFATTAAATFSTYTIEAGDSQQEEQAVYCFVSDFTLEGKSKEAVTMAATWIGRQAATGTYTNGLSPVAVKELLFNKGVLYIDTTGSTWGTTTKSNTLLGMSLSVTTGLIPVFAADGQLYFSFAKSTKPEVKLQVTWEHETTSVAQKALWRAGTAGLVRLKFTGPALTTAGATYTYKTAIIDLAGVWETWDALSDQDGNDIYTATMRAGYDTTAAVMGRFIVVNEQASLP